MIFLSSILILLISPPIIAAEVIILSVSGIRGPYCAYGLEKRLLEIEGVIRVDLLWKEEKIRVIVAKDKKITIDDVHRAVSRADYPYNYTIIP
jgi:mercuric ion binding protein